VNAQNLKYLSLSIAAAILSGCAGILKAPPISESPQVEKLVASNGGALKPDEKGLYPFNHAWKSDDNCAPDAETSIYVDPVDTSRIDPSALHYSRVSEKDVSKLAEYARKRIQHAFAERKDEFRVVEQPPAAGRVIELSLVEISGTDVVRNVLGTALSAFVPGGGLIAVHSSGTIGVEGVVKEASSGKPLFVFADRERGKTAPFSLNDFTTLSHAREAIDNWSEQIVESCAAAPGTRVEESSPVTLLPL
jgi:hypothetical protein